MNEIQKLKPTPEAIYHQLELTERKIKKSFDYAVYAGELIARGLGGREVALALTKLEEATMWINKAQELFIHAMNEGKPV